MNRDQIQGDWNQLKGRVRETWGRLTDSDIDIIGGQRQQLVGKLQQLYGLTREKAEEEVEDFCRSCHERAL